MNGFANGWSLTELKNTWSFINQLIKKFRFDSSPLNDSRVLTLSEFIQMRYINTCQIDSVTDNIKWNSNKWKKFSTNMILHGDLTDEILVSILNMNEVKRKELLFLLIAIENVTHSLNQKSNNNKAEVKLVSDKINDFFNKGKKFLEVTLSNADYQDLYIQHCNEEDKQTQNELNQKKRILDKKESEESKTNEYEFHRKNSEELAEKKRLEELEHYRKEAEAKMYKGIAEKKSKELAEKKRLEELEHYRKEAEAKMYKERAEGLAVKKQAEEKSQNRNK